MVGEERGLYRHFPLSSELSTGLNCLFGGDPGRVLEAGSRLNLRDRPSRQIMIFSPSPYMSLGEAITKTQLRCSGQ